jgi:hypothetical protein
MWRERIASEGTSVMYLRALWRIVGLGCDGGFRLQAVGGFLPERVSVSEGIVDGRVATSLSGLLVYWKEGAMLVVASPPE